MASIRRRKRAGGRYVWMVDFLDGRGSAPAVTGDLAEVVAWRLGRGAFRTVRAIDGSDPGEPPPW